MSSAPSDHAIQILSYSNENRKFELNTSELEAILNSPDVRDAEIAIISIAGALRKGKSFMLSFFLRYLNETYVNDQNEWLGGEDTELSGFSWRGGSERLTTGLSVWSRIFISVLPDGKKIGVMLMDTQGMFDNYSTMQDNITIFSMSTLLSSIQIYNLTTNIQEDNLQYLQLFTEYGKLAFEQNDEKAFQKLLFLVRDWSYPYEKSYGFEGGQKMLDQILEVTENQAEELAYVRNHIKSCFEELECFLMPYPGRIPATSSNFVGQLHDIDPEFKDMLHELIPALLLPEKISPKKISGITVTAETLMTYIEAYWKIFSTNEIPKALTILGATAAATNLAAKEDAIKLYKNDMKKANSGQHMLYFEQIKTFHDANSKRAIELFLSKCFIGTEKQKIIEINKLKDDLQSTFDLYVSENEAKKTKQFKESVDTLTNEVERFRSQNTQQAKEFSQLRTELAECKRTSAADKIRLEKDGQLAWDISSAFILFILLLNNKCA